jgi:membrane-bound acyltransferase YfiQ involved in biofilm formation
MSILAMLVMTAPNTFMSRTPAPPVPIVPSLSKYAVDHLFVNNVRFLSMAGVVACHCIGASRLIPGISSSGWLLSGMLQPFKFGTIDFFLISGFLMNEGLTRGGPLEYLRRRLKRVLTPWLFWFSLFYVMLLTKYVMKGELRLHSLRGNFLYLLDRLHICLFSSAYWFVPNLLLALCVLLLCRRLLRDLRFGCLLLALSLFYSLNIYAQWISVSTHTEALLGFVFYLWLGAWGARNMNAVASLVARISMPALIALAVITGMAAMCESNVLAALGFADTMDTLRISNQAYSVAIVLVIIKLRRAIWPRTWDVRASTFGIYLTHSIILSLLLKTPELNVLRSLAGQTWGARAGMAICLSLGGFAATYGCSLFLTRWLLSRQGLCWMVGSPAPRRKAGIEVGSVITFSPMSGQAHPAS